MNALPIPRALAAAMSVLGLASLTACGALEGLMPGRDPFLDQSPRSIAEAAFADMRKVTSLRILGDTEDRKNGRMQVDISVGEEGCTGSIATDEGEFQLRRNGDGTWVKGDEDFVRAQASSPAQADVAWKQLRGTWVPLDGKDALLELCDLDELLANFTLEESDTSESIDVDQVVQVGDADAVPLTGQKGKKRTTLWVALEAPHHVLKMAPAKDGGMPDALYFEEFGVEVVVETPAKKDILKLPATSR
ncbi:hypothetical protein EUA06_01940 [Nocardioides glacieisoli]|uniref:LppX_LprAFG lipoprotein n=1 Tax=Nocardioides glacieisoli TaxID=1168730 RepID=A0A4Q2S453_9ACTN|nr:hypothetical protein [Nocardioides glacieisoli]RYB96358.1 hypothetical protein EUA06_01940 [Nocardioides glacieisoli]